MDDGRKREIMVREQIMSRGIIDRGVLQAMEKVPRHLFVPEGRRGGAYGDYPLPIGRGQTISQPYIVAYMTEQLSLGGDGRVLEVGTGSGYQTAVISLLAAEVYTLEVIQSLSDKAKGILDTLGYTNVHYRVGDGYHGWEEAAPYDGILVTAAAPEVPEPLVKQLADGGVLVIPVGESGDLQKLLRVTKTGGEVTRKTLLDVRFVPFTRKLR